MRLLDVETMRVVEVRDDARPPYSILSHTWGSDEVSLQDIQLLSTTRTGLPRSDSNLEERQADIQNRSGYVKIVQAAAMAKKYGDQYIWIDTCCIDKTSSAELSEAINSMFRWYQESHVCFGYLYDVHDNGPISQSRWFSRGWTLQELIASPKMDFFQQDWTFIGSKSDATFCRILSDITGVDQRVLSGRLSPLDVSVANRMKWAARRETTRLEDIAYCLMGIFHVNMPLLYGEGSRAFVRLQEEILKETDDQSLFAWYDPWQLEENPGDNLYGLLATSPRQFADTGIIRPLPPLQSQETVPSSITNQGLRVQLYLKPVHHADLSRRNTAEQEYLAILDCSTRHDGYDAFPAICLRRLYGDQYARIQASQRFSVNNPAGQDPSPKDGYQTVYVRQNPRYILPEFTIRGKSRGGAEAPPTGDVFEVMDVYPPERWDPHSRVLTSNNPRGMKSVGIEALAIVRFASETLIHREVDVAVGLSRMQGRWQGWCYQFPTEGSNIAYAYNKFNDDLIYLARSDNNSDRMGTTATVEEVFRHGRSYMLLNVVGKAEIGGTEYMGPADGNEAIPSSLARDIEKELDNGIKRLLSQCSVQDTDQVSLWPEHQTQKVRVATSQTSIDKVVHILETGLEDAKFSDTEIASIWKLCKWTEAPTDLAWNTFSGLLRNGREILSKGSDEYRSFTWFHFATAFANNLVMERLLGEVNNSDDPSETIMKATHDGWTPAHIAAILSTPAHVAILRRIISQLKLRFTDESLEAFLGAPTAKMLDTPLHLAASYSRPETIEPILSMLLDMDEDKDINLGHRNLRVRNGLDEIPLHRACAMGNLPAVKLLMKHGPDSWNEVDRYGRSVVWHAAVGDRAPVIRLLVGREVLIDLADDNGRTPLHAACRHGNVSAVETLLELGANHAAETYDPGLTPAHFAALFGHVDCLKALITAKADVKRATGNADHIAFAPIHLAAANGHVECVKVLLKAGCDPFSKCSHYVVVGEETVKGEGEETALVPARGATAAEIARWRGHKEVVEAMSTAKELEYDWGTGMLRKGSGGEAGVSRRASRRLTSSQRRLTKKSMD